MDVSAPLSVAAAGAEDSAFVRLWRGFGTARVAIAAVLLALLSAMFAMAPPAPANSWLIGLCATYFAATLAVRLFAPEPVRNFDPQWVSTIGVDLLAISTLQYLQAGNLTFTPLFAVPVLMAAVLGTSLLAFGTAAGVALLLLADAWLAALQVPGEAAPRFLQAGLTGSGYFALAFLANQLAARLAREEHAARLSEQSARMQAQVNELVIDTLSDGVLVVDMAGQVQAANPAARAMLGRNEASGRGGFALAAEPGWTPLALMAAASFGTRAGQRGELALGTGTTPRRVHVRTSIAATGAGPTDSLCVMFLEDLREMEARLRTEKLAAMGRMSAAVAHEIRNPLAAIAQANALLDEDLIDPAQRQLSALVGQNARRLAQIVEEILDVARVQQQGTAAAPLLELDAFVAGACAEWSRQTGSCGRMQTLLRSPGVQVRFEGDHLRRVLVNLLDNALRYAGTRPESIQVVSFSTSTQASLVVWSDGAALEPALQEHLFEPFFSSESRSSGLGLYICRELCERHGALIGYRRGACVLEPVREGNEFFVSFHSATRAFVPAPAPATMIL